MTLTQEQIKTLTAARWHPDLAVHEHEGMAASGAYRHWPVGFYRNVMTPEQRQANDKDPEYQRALIAQRAVERMGHWGEDLITGELIWFGAIVHSIDYDIVLDPISENPFKLTYGDIGLFLASIPQAKFVAAFIEVCISDAAEAAGNETPTDADIKAGVAKFNQFWKIDHG